MTSLRCHAIMLYLCLIAPVATASEPKKTLIVPYERATDKPLEAKNSVVNETDDHTQYRVEFNGIKGDRVPAYVYVPRSKGKKGPYPAVLLQYGMGGNKKTDYIVGIARQFIARGFIVITIDIAGAGERKNQKTTNILGKVSPEHMLQCCGDYSRATDYLLSRPDVDKDRIGYVGLSWGAITGLTYVAHDQRVSAMASMVGGGNFLGLYTKEAAEKAKKEGSKSSDPVFHVSHIAPRPLLFINVTKDQLIFKSWAESLHRAAGPGSKVVWMDTDHYFKTVDREVVCNSVIDFMEKELVAKKPAIKK